MTARITLNRRSFFTVSGIAGMTGLLAACGSNSNTSSVETGYTTSNLNVMAALNTATVSGLWKTNALGECSINTDYCTAYETSEIDGVQTISIKLNPQAKFNDDTPVGVKALQVTHKTLTEEGYNIVDPGVYAHIASIEEDGDAFSVKITMTEPYYPIEGLFGTGLVPPRHGRPRNLQ